MGSVPHGVMRVSPHTSSALRGAESFDAGGPSGVDGHTDVVNGLPLGPLGHQGQKQLDELGLDDELLTDGRLLLTDGGYHLCQFACRMAVGEQLDISAEGRLLIYIYGESSLCFGERCIGLPLTCEHFASELIAIEMLFGMSGIGQDLILTSINIEGDV